MAICLQYEIRQYVLHGSSYSQISQGDGVCAHLDEQWVWDDVVCFRCSNFNQHKCDV